MRAWIKKPTTRASALVVVAFGFTVAIALLGGTAETSVLLLLTLLAGVFQYLGASKFHDAGRADPSLARSSVKRLLSFASRAQKARRAAETAYEVGQPAEAKRLMGVLSAELSFLEEGYVQAIEDWREFHADALEDIEKEQ